MDCWRYQVRTINCARVSKNALHKKVLQHIWKDAKAKEIPGILEQGQFIHFQYPGKPIIILSKKDGRLYCLGKETEWTRHQAYIILAILNKYKLVKGYKRRTVYKKEPKVEWVEDIV